jgi:hypothetical protein
MGNLLMVEGLAFPLDDTPVFQAEVFGILAYAHIAAHGLPGKHL